MVNFVRARMEEGIFSAELEEVHRVETQKVCGCRIINAASR